MNPREGPHKQLNASGIEIFFLLRHCEVVPGAVIRQIRAGLKLIFWNYFWVQVDELRWRSRSERTLLLQRCDDFLHKVHCSTQCMRAHGGDVKLMTHRQEDTCRLLQKWHVKCAGQDVDARDGEGLPLRQTPCGGWKSTLVDVTPCYSIHLLSLPAPSLTLHTIKTTSLAQAWWAWHRKWHLLRDPLFALHTPTSL